MPKAFAFLFALSLAACNSTGPSSNPLIQAGTYQGTFTITYKVGTDSASTSQSGATFTFSDAGGYTCGGGIFLPGGGEYDISGDTLFLKDMWVRVAIFDGTQVLDGPFIFTFNEGKLSMSQLDLRMNRYRELQLQLQ